MYSTVDSFNFTYFQAYLDLWLTCQQYLFNISNESRYDKNFHKEINDGNQGTLPESHMPLEEAGLE